MEKRLTIDDLVKKIRDLDEGTFTLGEFIIKIEDQKKVNNNESKPFTAKIIDDKYFYTFTIPFENNYSIYIQPKNYDYEFFYKKEHFSRNKESIIAKSENNEYYMTKNYISSKENNISCYLHNNTLIKKVDDKCSIGYNFDNDKMYLYNKKNNTVNDSLDDDYIKKEYSFKDDANNKMFNLLSESFKEELKKQTENEFYKKLIDTVNVPKLRTDLTPHFKELLNVATIFKNNKEHLNLLEDQNLLYNLDNFISKVVMNESDTLINEFKNTVYNNNLKDINSLRKLKKDINKIIKARKKNIKTKILKNTDIEN